MVSERKAERIAEAIQDFVRECAAPALLEKGEEPLPLLTDRFRLEVGRRGLWLEAWDERRMWSRRIVAAEEPRRKRLELEAFRMGKKPVRVTLVDVADARSAPIVEKTQRSAFSEQFRMFLNRHFGLWRLEEYRAEANLEESQSPLYPSALFTRGQEAIVAVAAPPRETNFHALTFALVFLDSIRKRHGEICASRLLLYLPEDHARPVVTLARHLDARKLKVEIWLYRSDGAEWKLDARDKGNLDSHLAVRASRLAGPAWWLDLLEEAPYVQAQEEADGSLSYRIRGYEVARLRPGLGNMNPDLHVGPKLRQEARIEGREGILGYFRQVSERRRAHAGDLLDPIYLAAPEGWLESSVRANLGEIDATLDGEVYGQVIGSHGGEKGSVDLLGMDFEGRLAILEMKASEDIHLPLQAFDYWLRIRQHVESGSFTRQGYFPQRRLANLPPRLLLVAPALHLHSTTQAILYFLPKDCGVEIVGLGANWRQRADVALRM